MRQIWKDEGKGELEGWRTERRHEERVDGRRKGRVGWREDNGGKKGRMFREEGDGRWENEREIRIEEE